MSREHSTWRERQQRKRDTAAALAPFERMKHEAEEKKRTIQANKKAFKRRVHNRGLDKPFIYDLSQIDSFYGMHDIETCRTWLYGMFRLWNAIVQPEDHRTQSYLPWQVRTFGHDLEQNNVQIVYDLRMTIAGLKYISGYRSLQKLPYKVIDNLIHIIVKNIRSSANGERQWPAPIEQKEAQLVMSGRMYHTTIADAVSSKLAIKLPLFDDAIPIYAAPNVHVPRGKITQVILRYKQTRTDDENSSGLQFVVYYDPTQMETFDSSKRYQETRGRPATVRQQTPQILAMHKSGMSRNAIAAKLGVSRSTVGSIINFYLAQQKPEDDLDILSEEIRANDGFIAAPRRFTTSRPPVPPPVQQKSVSDADILTMYDRCMDSEKVRLQLGVHPKRIENLIMARSMTRYEQQKR